MRSPGVIAAPWTGRYPERAEDTALAADRQWWRGVAAPAWSAGRELRRGRAFLSAVAAAAADVPGLDAAALADRVRGLRRVFSLRGLHDDGFAQAFALVGEVAHRRLGLRPHPGQQLGAWAILHGRLAEMDTGEGKTLTIALAAATAALAHRRTHVVTVNDYLVERDARELAPLYEALGLRVAAVLPSLRQPAERAAAWRADVVYCSNKTLVFDYLRDRVAGGARRGELRHEVGQLAGGRDTLLAGLDFGIVDEADSVLVDECRTPLVLSRDCPPIHEPAVFIVALELARALRPGDHYIVHAGERRVELTAAGRASLADVARGEFWSVARRREELVRQALAALLLFVRDEHYVVRDGAVQIVDPNTGRTMPDRAWELGLQQLIETREGCAITGAKETLARITYQRFFGRYRHLGATTGTAREVAGELWRVYGLRVLPIPRNRPSRNLPLGTTCHATATAQRLHVLARVRTLQSAGRPVLLATRTVAGSEVLAGLLGDAGLPHRVLNARHDADEAAIVAAAGEAGCITVATNMAGRGTDIRLGAGVEPRGGLHVIATECNESRRLDRQLFGRAGRQGDPGSFETIVSLDDPVLLAQLPAPLHAVARRLAARPSRINASGLRALLRLAQRRAEHRAARERRIALQEDRRLGDALAFSGSME
jgi:preprotein translocase subunit SecA